MEIKDVIMLSFIAGLLLVLSMASLNNCHEHLELLKINYTGYWEDSWSSSNRTHTFIFDDSDDILWINTAVNNEENTTFYVYYNNTREINHCYPEDCWQAKDNPDNCTHTYLVYCGEEDSNGV